MVDYLKRLFGEFNQFIKKYQIEILLILCIGMLPYKIFNLLKLDPYIKYGLGFTFLVALMLYRKTMIPKIFNHSLLQAFLFLAFAFENLFVAYAFLAFVVFFGLGFYLITLNPGDYVFTLSFLLMVSSLYLRLKNLLLNFEDLNPDLALEKAEDLTWEKISQSIAFFLDAKYQKSFVSRLPASFNKASFPYASRRYMFTRAFKHIGEHKETYALLTGGVATMGAGIGFVWSGAREDQKIKLENRKIGQEELRIQLDERKFEDEKQKWRQELDARLREIRLNEKKIELENFQISSNPNLKTQQDWNDFATNYLQESVRKASSEDSKALPCIFEDTYSSFFWKMLQFFY
jgi:hypothetical protein